MCNLGELRDDIRAECEEAVKNQELPLMEPELRHVYIEEFYKILERDRFIKPSSLVLAMLAKMGAVKSFRWD